MMSKNNLTALTAVLAMALCACSKEAVTPTTIEENEDSAITSPSKVSQSVLDEENSFNLTNETAAQYLSAADSYDTSDYTYTIVKDYSAASTSYRKDQPAPVTVTWDTEAGSAATVVVSETESYALPYTFTINKPSDGSCDIYNLIPGKTYYYKVVTSNYTTITEGTFNTTGALRMIRCNSSNNIRDLGGWESTAFTREDGTPKTVRYGKLYRGANVDSITKSDRKMMTGNLIGITYDLDLRPTKLTSSPFGLDAYYDDVHGLENIFYQNIKDSDKYAKMFEKIVARLKKGDVVYFHCAAGADRTGTLAFILEGVLGIKENDLVKDYELTSFGWDGNRVRTNEIYRFADMMNVIKDWEGDTLQEKFYNNLVSMGVPTSTIDWYIAYMLE